MDIESFESELVILLTTGELGRAEDLAQAAYGRASARGESQLLDRAFSALARVAVAKGDLTSAAQRYIDWLSQRPESLEAVVQAATFDYYCARSAASTLERLTGIRTDRIKDSTDAGIVCTGLNLRGIAELELGRVEDATKTLESLTVITAEWAHAGVWIEVGLAEELASRHLASQACRRFVAAAGKGKLEGEAETRLVALGRLLLSDEP